MAVTLTNQAKHLLTVPLNDGGSVYLAPGETSGALDESQLSGNERLGKMIRAGLINAAPPKSSETTGATDGGEAEESAASAGAPAEEHVAAGASSAGAPPPVVETDTTK
jgi:hypothetical protein